MYGECMDFPCWPQPVKYIYYDRTMVLTTFDVYRSAMCGGVAEETEGGVKGLAGRGGSRSIKRCLPGPLLLCLISSREARKLLPDNFIHFSFQFLTHRAVALGLI